MGDDYFFTQLPDLIDDAPDFDFLKTQFLQLAQVLEVNENFVRGLRSDMVNGTKSYSDLVKSIFQRWRADNGDDATAEKLCAIPALQEEWNEVAVFLLKNFSAMISQQTSGVPHERTYGKITYFPSKILGNGSSNTMVYQGKFEGRKVAVKKIICQIDDEKKYKSEINTLLECDGHKNIVKYFAMEMIPGDTLQVFLALELCTTTLGSWINKTYNFVVDLNHLSILNQVTKGLAYLHEKNIIHRDIKPDNILLKKESDYCVRVKITDFGISRRVPIDRSKVTVVTHTGTDGWKAPEILKVESESLNGYSGRSYQSPATDIFSLDCLFYYVLTEGVHPFGENPIKIQFRIFEYQPQVKVHDLIQNPECFKHIGALRLIFMMIAEDPKKRPPVKAILKHPIFWNNRTTVAFLADVVSTLGQNVKGSIVGKCWDELEHCPLLEAYTELGWDRVLTKSVNEYVLNQNGVVRKVNRRGKYDVMLIQDLIRLIRNLECHFTTQPDELVKELGGKKEKYMRYWQERFPFLIDSMWMKFEKMKHEPSNTLREFYSDKFEFGSIDIEERNEQVLQKYVLELV